MKKLQWDNIGPTCLISPQLGHSLLIDYEYRKAIVSAVFSTKVGYARKDGHNNIVKIVVRISTNNPIWGIGMQFSQPTQRPFQNHSFGQIL